MYDTYDIYRADADGSRIEPLTTTPGYDAEATIAKDGTIVFTSVRDGDMEIYTMRADGTGVTRLTRRPGPDGGPFFSPDGSQIVFRGRELQPGKELDDYQLLLKESLWRPTSLEIFVMNRDGSNVRQVTSLKGASFAPYWYPDGKRIIFSSNHHNPRGRDFELWAIDVDGTNLERDHEQPHVRRLPHVLARRQKTGFWQQPPGRTRGGHECVHRRLDAVGSRWSLSLARNARCTMHNAQTRQLSHSFPPGVAHDAVERLRDPSGIVHCALCIVHFASHAAPEWIPSSLSSAIS